MTAYSFPNGSFLAYGNRIASATLSLASSGMTSFAAAAGLPLSNVAILPLARVARFSALAGGAGSPYVQIRAAFASQQPIRCVGLLNRSDGRAFRVRLYSTTSFGTELAMFENGYLDPSPSLIPSHVPMLLPQTYNAGSIAFEFPFSTFESRDWDIGGLWASPALVIAAGPEMSSIEVQDLDASAAERSVDEQPYSRHDAQFRRTSATFSMLNGNEAIGLADPFDPDVETNNLESIADDYGTTSPVLFAPTIGGSLYALRRQFVHGFLTPRSDEVISITASRGNVFSASITVTEER